MMVEQVQKITILLNREREMGRTPFLLSLRAQYQSDHRCANHGNYIEMQRGGICLYYWIKNLSPNLYTILVHTYKCVYLVRILLAFDDNYRKVFLDFPILFEKGYDSRPGFRQNCSSFQLHTYSKDLNTFYDFTLPLYYMVWSSCVLPALPLLTNGKNISPLNHLKHVFL